MNQFKAIPATYLFPAGLIVSRQAKILNTVLGSCISVCLWDSVTNCGGMNHYMLPLWNGSGLASPKYGNIAIESLIEKLLRQGCLKKNLVAKVFGGAKMLKEQSNIFDIGKKNTDLAFETLALEGIHIMASSVGGTRGRKIFFNTHTGEVLQKYLGVSAT